MTEVTIGVDISKAHLDAACWPSGETHRVSNDAGGFQALVAWLAPWRILRVVFEPTGAFHRAFEQALDNEGFPLVKVNPRQARRFASSLRASQ